MKRLLQTQESVNPYQSVAVPADGTETSISRGILIKTALSVVHTVTLADGTSVALPASMPVGVYSLAVKKVDLASGTQMDIALLY